MGHKINRTIIGSLAILGVSSFLVVVQAEAAYFRCLTTSQGIQFTDADQDKATARQRTLSACTAHSQTNNGECRYNLSCDGDLPSDNIKCSTESQGQRFVDGDSVGGLSRQRTVAACTAHSQTNNGECRAALKCENDPYWSQWVCETQSQGLSFIDGNEALEAAQTGAVNACTAHSQTNNGECRSNLYCRQVGGGGNPPPPTPPPPPPPAGNLYLLGNGQANLSVGPNDLIRYQWGSKNVMTVSSFYFADRADTCQGGYSPEDAQKHNTKPWVVNTPNEANALDAQVQPCQAGVNYTIILVGLKYDGSTEIARLQVRVRY